MMLAEAPAADDDSRPLVCPRRGSPLTLWNTLFNDCISLSFTNYIVSISPYVHHVKLFKQPNENTVTEFTPRLRQCAFKQTRKKKEANPMRAYFVSSIGFH
jgi:hypothetical protein